MCGDKEQMCGDRGRGKGISKSATPLLGTFEESSTYSFHNVSIASISPTPEEKETGKKKNVAGVVGRVIITNPTKPRRKKVEKVERLIAVSASTSAQLPAQRLNS